MKTIGIIGGLSAAASAQYYQKINTLVNERLGGTHNAKSLMYSFDIHDFYPLFNQDKWSTVAEYLLEGAKRLEAGGADFIIIACNMVHMATPKIEPHLTVPFIHIVDPTGAKIKAMGFKKVGLLATRVTMERCYYKDRLRDRFGIETVIPSLEDRVTTQHIISDELVFNSVLDESHAKLVKIIGNLEELGAEGIILGCTELPLVLSQRDSVLPVFDGNLNHVYAAVDYALS
jgi:aspartate racemase